MLGNFLSCSKGVKDPLEVPEFNVITPYLPQQKWASSRLEGRTSWILNLERGPQGPAPVASVKASPHAICSGASRDSSPVDAGPKTLCGVGAGT